MRLYFNHYGQAVAELDALNEQVDDGPPKSVRSAGFHRVYSDLKRRQLALTARSQLSNFLSVLSSAVVLIKLGRRHAKILDRCGVFKSLAALGSGLQLKLPWV